MLIEIYLKFKGLIGQGNNTKKGVFDKIADEFNKHADIKGTGEQCLRKWKNWKQNKKKLKTTTGKWAGHIQLGNFTRKWSNA